MNESAFMLPYIFGNIKILSYIRDRPQKREVDPKDVNRREARVRP